MSQRADADREGDDREAAAAPAAASRVPVPLRPLTEDPRGSILITNKDYGRFLPDALDGVCAQTYRRWEAIVCDDGSTDDSRRIVDAYRAREPRITLVTHSSSRGQGAAFNSAFAASHGDIVVFLDADDAFRPAKLARSVDALRGSTTGLFVHPLLVVDADGGAVQRIPGFTRLERGWIADKVLRRGGRWRWVPTSGVALRREIAELVFPMPEEGYVSSADTYFLLLAPLLTPVDHTEEVLAIYRRHGANHFARTRFDAERVPRTIANLELSVARVNERLDQLQHPLARLRVDDNLEHAELDFQRALFTPGISRRQLRSRYGDLMERYRRDDLYGSLQRRWARILYLVAVVLPRTLRPRWVGVSLSATRAKEALRRVWVVVGRG
jgi:glycosyltransferase involved in cell wall biosynthesis